MAGKWRFQSTRPRGARLRRRCADLCALHVSIHAPARGATDRGQGCASAEDVSIHAPARGATVTALTPRFRFHGFNPRAREGRDVRYNYSRDADWKFQSTRPRGARLHSRQADYRCGQFQSTRPRGARHISESSCCLGTACFNPRAREGRDHVVAPGVAEFRGFNPRAREGRDTTASHAPERVTPVSIHAPARGATVAR